MAMAAAPYSYSLTRYMSRGSYGTVAVGRMRRTGEKVAVKWSDNRAGMTSIRNEREFLDQLQPHPNIVKLFPEWENTSHMVSIALELADCSVHDMLQNPRYVDGFPADAIIDLLSDIKSAFSHLLSKNIAHRDTKPANILVFPKRSSRSRSEFCFVLCDFGGSRVVADDGLAQTIVGTPGLLTPEVVAHLDQNGMRTGELPQGYDAALFDLWAMGGTFYQIATGRSAFPTETRLANAVLQRRPPGAIAAVIRDNRITYVSEIENEKWPTWLRLCVSQLIARCLDKDNANFNVFFEMVEDIWDVVPYKTALLGRLEVVELADLTTTRHFRDLDRSVQSILSPALVSSNPTLYWMGDNAQTVIETATPFPPGNLPSLNGVLWPANGRIVTEPKNWLNSFAKRARPQTEDPTLGFMRRRSHLTFGWKALDDSKALVEFVELLKNVSAGRIRKLLDLVSEAKARAQQGQMMTTFADDFAKCVQMGGVAKAEDGARNARRATAEFTRAIQECGLLEQQLNALAETLKRIELEEHPLLGVETDLAELATTNATDLQCGRNMDKEVEKWLETLCTRCAERRSLLAAQIGTQFSEREGLLFVIRNVVETGLLVDRVRENLHNSEGLLDSCLWGTQALFKNLLADHNLQGHTRFHDTLTAAQNAQKEREEARRIKKIVQQLEGALRKTSLSRSASTTSSRSTSTVQAPASGLLTPAETPRASSSSPATPFTASDAPLPLAASSSSSLEPSHHASATPSVLKREHGLE